MTAKQGSAARSRYAMPDDIERALRDRRLFGDYEDRPAYQRNDYLGWISQAKRDDTRQRRVDQMLQELEQGGVYMKMRHTPSRKD